MIFENEDVKFDYFNETLTIKYAGGERNWEIIPSKSIDKIDKFSFELNNETYTVIVIKYNGKSHFWCNISTNEYDDLLEEMADKKPEVAAYIKKYYNDYGYEHKFWKYIYNEASYEYNFDDYNFAKKIGLDFFDDDFDDFVNYSYKINFVKNFEKESFNDLYDSIVNYFLPDKIEATKRSLLIKEANEKQTAIINIYGECFQNKETVLNEYIQEIKNYFSAPYPQFNGEENFLNNEKFYWTKIKNENVIDAVWCEQYIGILLEKEKIVNNLRNHCRSQENEKKSDICQQQACTISDLPEKVLQTAVYAGNEHNTQENTENKKMGSLGEKEVNYALKWLDQSYIKISNPNVENPISLYNPDFIDESQEYDHIIIGKQGVFNIETKNFAGRLIVDVNGNWIRIRDNQMEGERNPIQQVRRHEKLLRSIIGSDIPIINIICMAHPKLIIEGVENCSVPIIKSDLLVEFIETYKSDVNISEDEIRKCVTQIEKHIK